MDTLLFRAINNIAHTSPFLDAVFIFISKYDEYLVEAVAVIALLVWFAFAPKEKKLPLAAISSLVAGLAVYWISGTGFFLYFHRARPSVVLSAVNLLSKLPAAQYYTSFPSAHAMFFFSLAGAVYYFSRKAGYVVAGGAAIVSLSKLFVGVHWPSDLAVGAILGALIGWIISFGIQAASNRIYPRHE